MNRCEVCGHAASVREVSPKGDGPETHWFCDEHSSVVGTPPGPPELETVDEEIRELVHALNRIEGVRTLCCCSGTHQDAVVPYVEIRPSAEDLASRASFERFARSLVAHPDLRKLFFIEGPSGGGLHLQVIDRSSAAVAWEALLDFIRARRSGSEEE